MEKLLTPLAIALILAVLGGIIHNYWFYDGKRRRIPGQHRYSSDCVNTFWARNEVPLWGFEKLELGMETA